MRSSCLATTSRSTSSSSPPSPRPHRPGPPPALAPDGRSTTIDDCTRLRVLRIYDKNNQKTAIQFADYVIARLPFQVETIQTDNGAEFHS
jgi:hypothetical protein